MTREEAEILSILLLQVTAKLDQSVAYVKDKDSEENFKLFRSGIAKSMGYLYADVKAPLWERFPDLKPEYLDGPYRIDINIFEPKFYETKKT